MGKTIKKPRMVAEVMDTVTDFLAVSYMFILLLRTT